MYLTERQKKLSSLLIKQRGVMTIDDYSKIFNVSTRTISNDLNKIENYLLNLGYGIERLPGVGLKVVPCMDSAYRDLNSTTLLLSEKEKRIDYILKKMLFNGETVTFEQLADELNISKSSIYSDFEELKKDYLNETTCIIKSDLEGTRLIGLESQFQRTFSLYNDIFLKKKFTNTNDDQDRIEFLSHIYGHHIVNSCNLVLYDMLFQEKIMIDEFYLQNILNVLIVMTFRSFNGLHIEEEIINESYYSRESHNKASEILSELSKSLNISFSESDKCYFAIHIQGNKFDNSSYDVKYEKEIRELIYRLEEILKIGLTDDDLLYKQLNQHFGPMVFRLENNIYNENPFVSQFKKEYGLLFNLLWLSVGSIEDKLNIKFTNDEISYLLIYFQLAIERNRSVTKVLLICPLGISASHLLMYSVQRLLPPLDVVRVVSLKQLTESRLSNVDFVISTTPIKIPNKEVLIVSPILTFEDKNNILNFYQKQYVQRETDSLNTETVHLGKYVSEKRIFINQKLNDKEEVFDFFENKLLGSTFDEGFIDSVKRREEQGDTSLHTSVAIPHGRPEFVTESGLSIIVLEEPILWGKNYIKVVILIHISELDLINAKSILGNVYSIVSSKKNVKNIFCEKEVDSIIGMLSGGIVKDDK